MKMLESGNQHSKDLDLLADGSKKKEMKVNIDIFVQLKKGTISDFYETGDVIGEGKP